jgi:antirestriction protein ArdC
MTNQMIILMESVKLMQAGILQSVGEPMKITVEENGKEVEKEVQTPEPIHTYQAWKSMGYQVKKGEKAIAQFPVWKMSNPSKKAQEEAEKEDKEVQGRMFLKTASFFKSSQVEEIKEKEVI